MIVFWTAISGLSLYFNLRNENEEVRLTALATAEAFFKDIVTTREWNAAHGGVYVPVTETTQPNPYLEDPRRDLTTADGLKLTKINPAFMTRQISELHEYSDSIQFHITSLKPIRPMNKPTEWEHRALESFEKDNKKFAVGIVGDGDQKGLRYMAPLIVDSACMKCHEKQGYKVGDIRGGISVTVPMAPYVKTRASTFSWLWISHAAFWFAGMVGIGFTAVSLGRNFTTLAENEELLSTTIAGLGNGVLVVSREGMVTLCNQRAEEMLGLPRQKIIGFPFSIVAPIYREGNDRPEESPVKKVFETSKALRHDTTDMAILHSSGKKIPVTFSVSPIRNQGGEIAGATVAIHEITDIKKAQKELALAAEILDRLNTPSLDSAAIGRILKILKVFAGVENAGIRISEGADYPFFSSIGLSDEFLSTENELCSITPEGAIRTAKGTPVHECICGHVIHGGADPDLPCFTEWGSFYSNDLGNFDLLTPEQLEAIRFRGRCPREGFRSVALIPLKSGDGIIGMLYLSDPNPGRFSDSSIRFLEEVSAGIGIAMEKIQIEKTLRDNEKRFRNLVDRGQDMISIASPDGTIMYQSRNMKRILGYESGEAVGVGSLDIVHPEDMNIVRQSLRECVAIPEKPFQLEYRIKHKNGTWKYIQATHTNMALDPTINGIVINARDVTEQREAEMALAREMELADSIAELSTALLSPMNLDEISFEVLEKAKELTACRFGFVGYIDTETGHLVSSTMTRDIWDTCQVHDKDVVFKKFCGLWGWVLENRKPILVNNPADDPRSSGIPEGHIPIENFLSAPAMAGEELLGQIALANCEKGFNAGDLEAVKQLADLYALAILNERAQSAVIRSEERLQAITDSALEAIVMTDENDRVSFWNPAAEDMFGLPAGDAIGREPWLFMTPEFGRDRFSMAVSKVKNGNEGNITKEVFDFTAVHRDGREFEASSSVSPIQLENGTGTVIVMRNVTSRKRVEDAMLFLVKGTAAHTGEEFFMSMVKNLAAALQVKYALVTECENWPPRKVRTMAVWARDDFGENMEYELDGTPCEDVFTQGKVCIFPSGIQEKFPRDHILQEMSAESYIGAPIFDSSGNFLGNIAVLDDKPLPEDFDMAPIVKVFAARAGAELERMRAVNELELHRENLKDIVNARTKELQAAIDNLNKQVEVRLQAEGELRALSKKTISLQEEERARLSRELHDDLGQRLTIMRLELDWLKTLKPDEISSEQFDEMIDKVVDATKNLRLICQGLRPLILDDLGISDAMEELALDMGKRNNIDIQLNIEKVDRDQIPAEASICFFRVLQEALNNTAKHARASSVTITFGRENKEYALIVEDDGKGFSPELPTSGGRLGIIGMKERASLCGGSLEVNAGKNGGTIVTMRVPSAR